MSWEQGRGAVCGNEDARGMEWKAWDRLSAALGGFGVKRDGYGEAEVTCWDTEMWKRY